MELKQSSNTCILKNTIRIVFLLIVLTCNVMSKLTLVSLTDALRNRTWDFKKNSSQQMEETVEWREKNGEETIALYWYLLLILLLPNVITFLRCLFFGALGKTKKSYPWPRWSPAFLVSGCVATYVHIHVCTILFLLYLSLSTKCRGGLSCFYIAAILVRTSH